MVKYLESWGIKPNPSVNVHKSNRIQSGFKWTTKKNPQILFLSYRDWASTALRLSDAINQHTEWTSNCVSSASNLINNPLLVNKENKDKIIKLMQTADVIVYGGSFYGWAPYDAAINPNAILGIWHPGSAYRDDPSSFNIEIHPHIDFIVVGHDFEKLCDNPIVKFSAVEVKPVTSIRRTYPIVIGHSPTANAAKTRFAFNKKGTHHLIKAMDVLSKKYGSKIKLDIVYGLSLKECIARKVRHHIFFDQISPIKKNNDNPMYGTSMVEAALYGSVCLSHANIPGSPFFCVKNSDDIIRVISYLMDNRSKLDEFSTKTIKWAKEHHSYNAVGNKFISDLELKLSKINEVTIMNKKELNRTLIDWGVDYTYRAGSKAELKTIYETCKEIKSIYRRNLKWENIGPELNLFLSRDHINFNDIVEKTKIHAVTRPETVGTR